MSEVTVSSHEVDRVLAERRAAAERSERAKVAAELEAEATRRAERQRQQQEVEQLVAAAQSALAEAAVLLRDIDDLAGQIRPRIEKLRAAARVVERGFASESWAVDNLDRREINTPSGLAVPAELVTGLLVAARRLGSLGRVDINHAIITSAQKS